MILAVLVKTVIPDGGIATRIPGNRWIRKIFVPDANKATSISGICQRGIKIFPNGECKKAFQECTGTLTQLLQKQEKPQG